MEVSFGNKFFKITEHKKTETKQNIQQEKTAPRHKTPLSKIKTSALVGLFLLPTLGLTNCSNTSNNAGSETVEEYTEKYDNKKYLNISDSTFYAVKSGDTPAKIAEKFNISTRRLLSANGLTKTSTIYPDDKLLIPQAYTVKNIKTIDDVAKMSGIYASYLKDLTEFEKVHNELYKDRNGNNTIGIGHLVTKDELAKFKGKELTNEEIYTILAQDLLDIDLDLQTVINENAYKNMPVAVKESVIDLAFNKGIGAIADNKELSNALNSQNWVTAIANLDQDYSVVTNAKGKKVHKPASGLSKRRLYDMQNAARIYTKGMPDEILNSAKEVYLRGLKYMEQEKNRGEISKEAYPNVLKEYKNLAYKWFDGKIGEKSNDKASSVKKDSEASKTTPSNQTTNTVDNSKTIYVKGKKTNWTVSSLYSDWEKTAERQLRYVKRPLPEIDSKGNIIAYVKTINPTGKGSLSGKTILINPGHGGAMNTVDKHGKINVNFDPGTSNAVMSKKNPNIETNTFIGNGGKSLEEWVVNQRISDELVKKITAAGGKVIYVQGSVYSAMNAIRDIQKKQKINMIVSLHSNSSGGKRGIHVYANKRGGLDKKDDQLAATIVDNLNEHSWFRGITEKKAKSLGVLSASGSKTSPVPGVLIETGDLKNKDDVANLNSRNFKNQMIESIFDAIEDYLK